MALVKCKECGNEVSTEAKTCPKCGAPVARKPIGCGSAIVLIVLLFVVGKYVDSYLRSDTPSPPVASPPRPSSSASSASGNCETYTSVRQGWLLDNDRRGEIALWERPAPPFRDGNKIAAVIAFENVPRGESVITDVTEQCLVGGILYYHIRFDERRKGWVDVDYLHWKKVRR